MREIYKYTLPMDSEPFVVRLQRGAKILSLQIQNNVPCIWAMVDPDATKEARKFFWTGTGIPISAWNAVFIGTLQFQRGEIVFHLFETT